MANSDDSKLYNKYRPKVFGEVVGQDMTVKVLQSLAMTGRYSVLKNFILHSPIGGVGKTLLARIFAKSINCLGRLPDGNPCGECANCLSFESGGFIDYMELDGSTYNGIERIKPIVDIACQFPFGGGHRVIVIDEYQRVSTAGQDAMLKLLEEGANKNIFIMCTTDIDGIQDTIRTRCIHLPVSPLPFDAIFDRLKFICSSEGIRHDDRALRHLAWTSRGSVREAIKMLDVHNLSFGVVDSRNMMSSYSELLDVLVDSVSGKVNGIDDRVYRLGMKEPGQKLGELLYEVKRLFMSGFEWKDRGVLLGNDLRKAELVRDDIDQVIELYLKYKPRETSEVILFLSILRGEESIARKGPSRLSGSSGKLNTSIRPGGGAKITVDELVTKYGCKIIGVKE